MFTRLSVEHLLVADAFRLRCNFYDGHDEYSRLPLPLPSSRSSLDYLIGKRRPSTIRKNNNTNHINRFNNGYILYDEVGDRFKLIDDKEEQRPSNSGGCAVRLGPASDAGELRRGPNGQEDFGLLTAEVYPPASEGLPEAAHGARPPTTRSAFSARRSGPTQGGILSGGNGPWGCSRRLADASAGVYVLLLLLLVGLSVELCPWLRSLQWSSGPVVSLSTRPLWCCRQLLGIRTGGGRRGDPVPAEASSRKL